MTNFAANIPLSLLPSSSLGLPCVSPVVLTSGRRRVVSPVAGGTLARVYLISSPLTGGSLLEKPPQKVFPARKNNRRSDSLLGKLSFFARPVREPCSPSILAAASNFLPCPFLFSFSKLGFVHFSFLQRKPKKLLADKIRRKYIRLSRVGYDFFCFK